MDSCLLSNHRYTCLYIEKKTCLEAINCNYIIFPLKNGYTDLTSVCLFVKRFFSPIFVNIYKSIIWHQAGFWYDIPFDIPFKVFLHLLKEFFIRYSLFKIQKVIIYIWIKASKTVKNIPDMTETFIKSPAALSLKRSNRIGLPLFVIQGIFHKTVISILTNYRSLKMSVWGFGHVRLGILFHKDISVIIGFITTDAAYLRYFEVSQLV